MASSPPALPHLPSSYDKSSQKPNKSEEASEQPYILLSADPFSNDCKDHNYDTGFQTAPSSPPCSTTSSAADSSTQTSPPPSPKLLKQLNISPLLEAKLHGRDALPSHHLLKVDSFSSLSKVSVEKYSSEFEAGGYKWRFSIYPTGNKTKEGQDHISLYLEMVDTTSFPAGWEVYAIFNFFVFDQIHDKYVGFQDATVRRFHCMKTQCGIAKFLDLETFNNPSNGYIVNDTCSFGVEVFIVKSTSKVERLSMIKDPVTYKHAWMFDSFSRKTVDCYESKLFVGGDYKWRIVFFPSGCQPEVKIRNNNIISVGLEVDSLSLPPGTKLFSRYIVRMRDQTKGNHFERSENCWFSSASLTKGFRDFMSLTKFKDPENGFLVNDACIIEVEFEVLGLVTLE
ncbi:E3 ubiquitin-protein ligase SIN-like [Parasponia andersonii]|uniref:E3 ubiquitin-protein ligase SIN-like n=1 Tax=Parasponia andersonii TaxID=3476 RepID=A0A2P5A8J4_PARAD|nr:E3 ubiquitin-protein ligase SIN-like [Parasponia andersonii]